jgi:hypothetical protein
MLKSFLLKAIPFIFIISCSKELEKVEVNIDEIIERDGFFFTKDTNELFTGITKAYFQNGSLKYKDTYANGMTTFMNEYHENGQIKSKYSYKEGNLNGLYIELFDNGSTESLGIKKDGLDDLITIKGSRSGLTESISCSINGNEENLAVCINLIFLKGTCLEELLADQGSIVSCPEVEYINSFESNLNEFFEDGDDFLKEVYELTSWLY